VPPKITPIDRGGAEEGKGREGREKKGRGR